jgi:hypothetical protein
MCENQFNFTYRRVCAIVFPKCQRIIYNFGPDKYTERLVDAILTNPLVIEQE